MIYNQFQFRLADAFSLKALCLCLFISLFFLRVNAQSDVPIGTWRAHISFNSIHSIAISNNKIYGAAHNGIVVVDRDDNSIDSYSKLKGLHGSTITTIAVTTNDVLLIGYDDGMFDLISGNSITNNNITATTTITGSKRINKIAIYNDVAYLSTDYGVVLYDISNKQVKETWRDIGVGGEQIRIFQSAIVNENIALATNDGLMIGSLNDNLLDYNKWKHFSTGDLDTAVQYISVLNNTFYAAANKRGLFRFQDDVWLKEASLEGQIFNDITTTGDALTIITSDKIYSLNLQNEMVEVGINTMAPLTAYQIAENNFWIGDERAGLVNLSNGSAQSFLPNGPSISTPFRLKYVDNKIYLLSGGFNGSRDALANKGVIDVFENGFWSSSILSLSDVTDIEFAFGNTFISSFGSGVLESGTAGTKLYNETNSTLTNLDPPKAQVYIPAMSYATDFLYVLNYGSQKSLHQLNNAGVWRDFSFPFSAAAYPVDMIVGSFGQLWIVLDPAKGGGMLTLNPETNAFGYITDQKGFGELPGRNVYAIETDNDGYVWVGTDIGVAYFYDPSNDAVKPIYENRFLLKDDRVTAIAVDGANRKWMGTMRGVWLFDSNGEKMIYNFTTSNSPLISDHIIDIEINDLTGEVFFATDRGLVSFRADATKGSSDFNNVKIFPNPVVKAFSGSVGISGLSTNATVKITDSTGRLIWQTSANGGTASWNVRDYTGRRATTGVYLVFAASEDGTENFVGKLAVVE